LRYFATTHLVTVAGVVLEPSKNPDQGQRNLHMTGISEAKAHSSRTAMSSRLLPSFTLVLIT